MKRKAITSNLLERSLRGLLVIMAALLLPQGAWADDVWSGEGTEEHPYVISSPAGLDLLATRVNGGNTYEDTYFILGDNITYTTENTETEDNYTAIGDNAHHFKGNFDGRHFIISGIRIYKDGNDDASSYQGLFGYNEGTVKNLILADTRIAGFAKVGGIAGENEGNITNCQVLLNVTISAIKDGAQQHGGIVGYQEEGLVAGCPSAAAFTTGEGVTSSQVGGIAGYSGEGGIKDCLCFGGANLSDITIDGVSAKLCTPLNYTAFGDDATVSTYYGCITAYAPTADEAAFVLKYEVKYGETPVVGYYCPVGATVKVRYTGDTEGRLLTWYVQDSDGDVEKTTNYDLCSFIMPNKAVQFAVNTEDVWYVYNGAKGTEEKPYVISTPEGLDLLATMVNSGTSYGADSSHPNGYFFVLSNDIAYDHTTYWNVTNSTENNFTAIGNKTNAFAGHFDGKNYAVKGIRIYKNGDDDASSYQGLFGNNKGTIQNVAIADARITGFEKVGGIAGETSGNITNCYAEKSMAIHAIKEGAQQHGGIAGLVSEGKLTSCASGADITKPYCLEGCSDRGGIIGAGAKDCLQHCLYLGTYDVPGLINNDTAYAFSLADDVHFDKTGTEYGRITVCNGGDSVYIYKDAEGNETYYAKTMSLIMLTYSGEMLEGSYPVLSVRTWAKTVATIEPESGKYRFYMADRDVEVAAGPAYELTIGAGQYITMFSAYPLMVGTEDEEIKLQTITSVTNGEIVLGNPMDAVPMNKPFLIHNSGTTAKDIKIYPSQQPDLWFMKYRGFKGTLEDQEMPASDETTSYYVCNGTDFVLVKTAGTIAAHRCWLEIEGASGARQLRIVNGGEATGIKAIDNGPLDQRPLATEGTQEWSMVNGQWYDLSGRKLTKQPTKAGIYVKNGKKVIIK